MRDIVSLYVQSKRAKTVAEKKDVFTKRLVRHRSKDHLDLVVW
jgi:hypothetical protein